MNFGRPPGGWRFNRDDAFTALVLLAVWSILCGLAGWKIGKLIFLN